MTGVAIQVVEDSEAIGTTRSEVVGEDVVAGVDAVTFDPSSCVPRIYTIMMG
jgi:hypothetical protein